MMKSPTRTTRTAAIVAVLLAPLLAVQALAASPAEAQSACASFVGETAAFAYEIDSTFTGQSQSNTEFFAYGAPYTFVDDSLAPMVASIHSSTADGTVLGDGARSVGGSFNVGARTEIVQPAWPQFGVAQVLSAYKVWVDVQSTDAVLELQNYVLAGNGSHAQVFAGISIESDILPQNLVVDFDVDDGMVPPPPSQWAQHLEIELEPAEYELTVFVLSRLSGTSSDFEFLAAPGFVTGEWQMTCGDGQLDPLPQHPARLPAKLAEARVG